MYRFFFQAEDGIRDIGVTGVQTCALPIRDRSRGVALLCSLAVLGLLSTLYAWDTYDLPHLLAGLLGGSETSATGTAVNMAIGTQSVYPLYFLIGAMVSQTVRSEERRVG